MSDWIHVDAKQLRQPEPRQETHRGMNLSVHVSPYDIPEAVKGTYDDSSEAFVIHFRYLDAPSQCKEAVMKNGVKFHLDRQGRILRVLLPKPLLCRAGAESLAVNLQSAVNEMEGHWLCRESRENHLFANEVICGKRDYLFRDTHTQCVKDPWRS
jgi:hypothetical protein